MTEQSFKKARHNGNRTTISIDGDIENINSDVVSLIIKNNQVVSTLSKLQSLTYLKLINTKVSTIANCKWLTTAVIQDNNQINNITNLNKLDDLQCIDCNQLEIINLQKLRDLVVQNCPNLFSIKACNLINAVFINCFSMRTINLGNKLNKLVLTNCNQVQNLTFLVGSNINQIELINCKRLHSINSINNCGTIIIRECQALTKIDANINCNLMQIEMCDNLTIINKLNSLKCIVSRCSGLKKINANNIDNLIIDYCNSMIDISTSGIKEMFINYCDLIKKIYIYPETEIIKLKDCISFESFYSKPIPINAVRNIAITLIGKFSFDHITKLFVSSLTIIDNYQIYNIDTIHDLQRLEIINCTRLETVENSVIVDSLVIKNCRNLHTISDIMAIRNLTLINLPHLSEFNLVFIPIEFVFIEDCLKLSATLPGQWIKYLTLIDTNIISIDNLANNAIVEIKNSRYLPDIVSNINAIDTPLMDEDTPDNAATIELNKYFETRNTAVNKIIHVIRIHQIRLLKDRLHAALTERMCVVCLDEIALLDRFISKCFHTFHIDCIYTWSGIRNTCPLCNQTSIFRI